MAPPRSARIHPFDDICRRCRVRSVRLQSIWRYCITFGFRSNPDRLRGMYQDAESDLYATPARYYDPGTGQWLTRDPAVALTRSAYNYAEDSPPNLADPTGLGSEPNGCYQPGDTYEGPFPTCPPPVPVAYNSPPSTPIASAAQPPPPASILTISQCFVLPGEQSCYTVHPGRSQSFDEGNGLTGSYYNYNGCSWSGPTTTPEFSEFVGDGGVSNPGGTVEGPHGPEGPGTGTSGAGGWMEGYHSFEVERIANDFELEA